MSCNVKLFGRNIRDRLPVKVSEEKLVRTNSLKEILLNICGNLPNWLLRRSSRCLSQGPLRPGHEDIRMLLLFYWIYLVDIIITDVFWLFSLLNMMWIKGKPQN